MSLLVQSCNSHISYHYVLWHEHACSPPSVLYVLLRKSVRYILHDEDILVSLYCLTILVSLILVVFVCYGMMIPQDSNFYCH